MDNESAPRADLHALRRDLAEHGAASDTTAVYQDDLANFLRAASHIPGPVIEVGAFYGGLTVQLAALCREAGRPCFTVDVEAGCLAVTREHLARNRLDDACLPHHGDLASCLQGEWFGAFREAHGPPLLVIIDGDHRYAGVRADIAAVQRHAQGTRFLAFHDVGLRFVRRELAAIRVDLAILHALDTAPARRLGVTAGQGPLRTTPNPADPEDDYHHAVGFPEGLLVRLGETTVELAGAEPEQPVRALLPSGMNRGAGGVKARLGRWLGKPWD